METHRLKLFCIIPSYKAAATIADVVREALERSEVVVVVDDACPERSGEAAMAAHAHNANMHVIRREKNGGVGAAMKTGIAYALENGADIIVKIDADGQMDPSFIDIIRNVFEADSALVLLKGNRFFDSDVMRRMPVNRLFGNAVLSLMVKVASGYWNSIDPTNGYLAFNANLLRLLPWQNFDDSYFFEISVLCELGLRRLPIVELEMPTIYTAAPSSLSISRVIYEFPPKIFRLMLRRMVVQYLVLDVNLGTVYFVLGSLLALFGAGFGAYEWIVGLTTHTARATGTIMLAVLPFLMGFQLILNAFMHDVQFSPKTQHELLVNVQRRIGRIKQP